MLSATSWVTSIHTVIVQSTTRSCALPSRGHCATHLFKDKETSAHQATIPPQPSVTPSVEWHHLPWKWSVTSTKIPSTSNQTTTVALLSHPFFQVGSPTFWSTEVPVLQSVWPPTSHRTTCVKLLQARNGCWLMQSQRLKSVKPPLWNWLKGLTSQQVLSLLVAKESKTPNAQVVVQSPCARWSPSTRTNVVARFWLSPHCLTR